MILKINSLVTSPVLLITISLFHSSLSHNGMDHGNWNYSDIAAWPKNYPACGGQRQSPINIVTGSLDSSTYSSSPIQYSGYDIVPQSIQAINVGHALVLQFKWGDEKATISGGALGGEYYADTMYFHWDRRSDKGSEHTIDGVQYTMEAHVIHVNTEYADGDEAKKHEDGFAVVAALINNVKVRPEVKESKLLSEVINNLGSLTNPGDSTEIEPYSLQDFKYDPSLKSESIRVYNGSYPMPPCLEDVVWLISTLDFYINESQLETLQTEVNLAHDDQKCWRGVQPLNGRTVYSVPTSS